MIKMRIISKLFHNRIIKSKPHLITVDLTYSCPLKCITCNRGRNISYENELELIDYKEIFQQLKKWNIDEVVFCGGEPFVKKGILKIIEASLKCRIYPKIMSNGFLITKNLVQQLKELGIKSLTLSLNSGDTRIHDYTRGVKGSYDKIISAINELQKNSIRITIFAILLKQNIVTIPELIRWVKRNNFQVQFQVLFSPTFMFDSYSYEDAQKQNFINLDPYWFKENKNWIDDTKEFEKIIGLIINLKHNNYPIINSIKQLHHFKQYYTDPTTTFSFKCKVGEKNLSIDPYGNVRLCFAMPPIGNIKNMSLIKIWTSNKAKDIRKMIDKCELNCKLMQCNY